MPTSTGQSFVVLERGADVRLLGGSAHARNARVASRAGAAVVAADMLPESDEPAILVPPHVAIDGALFPLPHCPEPAALVPAESAVAAPGVVIAASARALRRLLIDAAPGAPPPPPPRGRSPPGALFDLSTPVARTRAMRTILQRTGKPSDGWVSRHCNRPLSRALSAMMLSLGLRPAHASVLTLIVGIAAAIAAAQPGYAALVASGALFHLASVLDGVDGEMARATLTESEPGARLDTIVDQLTYLACFAGLAIGWSREGRGEAATTWGLAVVAALLFSLWRGRRFVSRHAPNASFVFIDRCVRRAANDTRQSLLKLAVPAFALLRRDLFALAFMLIALAGNRALFPGLIAAGAVVANLTLTVYARELAIAAIAERQG